MDLSVASSRRPAAETQVGYGAGKQVKGRKIHAPVDSEGLPVRFPRPLRRDPGPR
jgi:hypothetical protein